jgi:decaprenylphospho-beta-D-ribofuranose 2-oxidase
VDEVVAALQESADTTLLARGAGRSYGDVALNGNGRVLRTIGMTAIYGFEPATGVISVAPGVSFGQLLRQFAPHGWIPPVTPGTQFATIGGAIANDVHGKNHDTDGSFGDHLLWFDLALADGSVQRINVESSPELFAATVGGIGLTGIITRATFRMRRVPGPTLLVRERRLRDLEEYLDALAEARGLHHYSVGWIDGVATGRRLGRGILETADHIEDKATGTARHTIRMPFDLPSRTINSMTVNLFNRLYYQRVPARGRERRLDLERFFYPLDAIIDWNRMYGRAGFVQFQCVVPDAEARRAIRKLLERITASGRGSFLAVIKTLGRAGRGLLSFPRPGVTLALDFPRTPGIAEFLTSLHEVTLEHGGRIYLAKDSCVTARQFQQMYPRSAAFQAILRKIDPSRRMRSDMSIRLQL